VIYEHPWTTCQSSNVAGYRRAAESKDVDLEVMFNDGSVYTYVGAGKEYEPMRAAPSKGKFRHQVLSKYDYFKH
jgi:hypothetical protein